MTLTTVNAGMLDTQAQYNGFKNRIINGAMVIDQRNAGASVALSSSVVYSVDRFQCRLGTSTSSTAQQSSTVPSGFSKSLLLTIGTGASPSAGAGTGYFSQSIEGFNCADLEWGTANAQPVTLSFWIRSSLIGTFGICVGNDALTRTYPTSYTINAANTWEYKTITILGSTSGSFPTDNTGCVRVMFDWGSGSNYKGTANTWANADYRGGATGTQSICATSGATWQITGVQLEKGSTATSFDYRPIGTELALCQRYFEKSYDQGTAPATNTTTGTFNFSGASEGNGNVIVPIQYSTKRTAPTLTGYLAAGTSGSWNYERSGSSTTGSITFDRTSDRESRAYIAVGSNFVAAYVYGHWIASAEL